MLFCQYLTIQCEFKIGKGIEVEENDAEGLHSVVSLLSKRDRKRSQRK